MKYVILILTTLFVLASCVIVEAREKKALKYVDSDFSMRSVKEGKMLDDPLAVIAILTGYCPCEICCSWHKDKDGVPRFNSRPTVEKIIGQTASGIIAKEGVTLALPSNIPFGSKVYLTSGLLGKCQDRGGAISWKTFKSDKNPNKLAGVKQLYMVDVYFDKHEDAIKFGRSIILPIFIVPEHIRFRDPKPKVDTRSSLEKWEERRANIVAKRVAK